MVSVVQAAGVARPAYKLDIGWDRESVESSEGAARVAGVSGVEGASYLYGVCLLAREDVAGVHVGAEANAFQTLELAPWVAGESARSQVRVRGVGWCTVGTRVAERQVRWTH
jgi:hypothetical protein